MYEIYVCPLLTYMLIPMCTSGKYVDILATDALNRESVMVGPIYLV